MTATFQITRDLGWEYLEKLAKQKIMQVQSSTDPPKKLALGERAVMVDGNEYNALQIKEKRRVRSRSSIRPKARRWSSGRTRSSRPRRIRTRRGCSTTGASPRSASSSIINVGSLRSVHPQAKDKPGWRPLKDIKVMKDDAAGVEKTAPSIKARYTKIFGV